MNTYRNTFELSTIKPSATLTTTLIHTRCQMRPESHEYFLIPTSVDLALETHHLQHADIAAQLGISRSYWSQLVNGRKLSPKVRRALREHPVLSGLAEDALWAQRRRSGA